MPRKPKVYESERWLRRKFIIEKLSQEEIAELAGTSQATISRYLTKFGLIKNGLKKKRR